MGPKRTVKSNISLVLPYQDNTC